VCRSFTGGCSVLQCIALCYNLLQCVVLRRAWSQSDTAPCIAVRCSVLAVRWQFVVLQCAWYQSDIDIGCQNLTLRIDVMYVCVCVVHAGGRAPCLLCDWQKRNVLLLCVLEAPHVGYYVDTATHCNTLQHTATRIATNCNTLQHALQQIATRYHRPCKKVSHPTNTPLANIKLTLQHTATHCYTLQHDALQHTVLHCNALPLHLVRDINLTLQRAATHCNTLRHTATHCDTLRHTLQHTATYRNTLQQTATLCHRLQCCATHCDILQKHSSEPRAENQIDTATHCNTLQHIATYCNTLQHTAAHSAPCLTSQVDTASSHIYMYIYACTYTPYIQYVYIYKYVYMNV